MSSEVSSTPVTCSRTGRFGLPLARREQPRDVWYASGSHRAGRRWHPGEPQAGPAGDTCRRRRPWVHDPPRAGACRVGITATGLVRRRQGFQRAPRQAAGVDQVASAHRVSPPSRWNAQGPLESPVRGARRRRHPRRPARYPADQSRSARQEDRYQRWLVAGPHRPLQPRPAEPRTPVTSAKNAAILATAHNLSRWRRAVLRDDRSYTDSGIHYQRLVGARNPRRWLRRLRQYGSSRRPKQPDVLTPSPGSCGAVPDIVRGCPHHPSDPGPSVRTPNDRPNSDRALRGRGRRSRFHSDGHCKYLC